MMSFVSAWPKNITLVCFGTVFPVLFNAIRVKNQFKKQKTPKHEKQQKKPEKKARMMQQMNTECTTHGFAMVSSIFVPSVGWPLNRCHKILPR